MFIDLRKACDCIPKVTLLKTLHRIQIKSIIIEVIKVLYRDSKIKIKNRGKNQADFPLQRV